MQLFDGDRLDPFRRTQCFDIEPQVPRQIFFRRNLFLQLFEPIPVTEEFEVLASPEQQHDHKDGRHCD